MPNITLAKAAKYTLLPGIFPRLRALFSEGLANLAFMLAVIYNCVGILPSGHAYLIPANLGKYGFGDVLIEASQHLKFKAGEIDKIIIYFVILGGIILLIFQALLMLVMLVSTPSMAQATLVNFNFFVTQNPEEDIALRLLDLTFGIPDFFGSKDDVSVIIAGAGRTFAPGFHQAIHSMYILYSVAIMVVALIVGSYFIGVVLIETAETGTPFGKRYNNAWVPLRIVLAFGLLVPVGYGYNGAQYFGLYAAKWGSAFATNGWLYFNNIVGTSKDYNYLGAPEERVARPQIPEFSHIPSYVALVRACHFAYQEISRNNQTPRVVEGFILPAANSASGPLPLAGTSFLDARRISGDIIHIRFGEREPAQAGQNKDSIRPTCGDIVFDVMHSNEEGLITLMEGYYNLIKSSVMPNATAAGGCGNTGAVATASETLSQMGQYLMAIHGPDIQVEGYDENALQNALDTDIYPDIKNSILNDAIEAHVETCRDQAITELQLSDEWDVGDLMQYGWGGAGIGMNRYALINGGLATAMQGIPRMSLYPDVMERVKKQRLAGDDNTPPADRFNPELEQGGEMEFQASYEKKMAIGFNTIFRYFEDTNYRSDPEQSYTRLSTNAFVDAVNAILGTKGLLDICDNADIHPMAQLTALGKTMVEASIRNMGYSLASSALGGIASMASPHLGAAAKSASQFFSIASSIGLSMGFMLFYLLPFMPFLYFFFAVGGWVKGVFEAMLGLPLWALAHLRIDGDGLPGSGGTYGYFLVLEIFLRPFIIVMGFLASITFFSAMVKVLNDIFHLVVTNVTSSDPERSEKGCSAPDSTGLDMTGLDDFARGTVDEIFFTVLYVILVYMIGMSSFKLIDSIPNNILRWMGQSVKSFNDERQDPTKNLIRNIMVGGQTISGQLQGAGQQLGQGVSEGTKAIQGLAERAGGGD